MKQKPKKQEDEPQPAPEGCFRSRALAISGLVLVLAILGAICFAAYDHRLHSVRVYGRIIHEFDPWFNYRCTEYLVKHGWSAFRDWFDDQSWYPLGRHVGSTVYPAMMVTAAAAYHALHDVLGLVDVSLNDVCVLLPAYFACLTCLLVFGLTYEVSSGSTTSALFAAAFMSVIPAHMMRSVAGGFDNESVAVAAIVGTFFFWLRSLRTPHSWPVGVLTGLSYVYMVAAWGAYTFVLNMIGLHAGVLVLLGRFTPHLHHAYSLWYIIGTAGALQFPIVGWQPFQSMEQIMPLGVFFLMQLQLVQYHMRQRMEPKSFQVMRLVLLGLAVAVGAVAFQYLLQIGWIGPLSNRVRSLFIPHTKTGNPLVDSVAEHQATGNAAYWVYFHITSWLAPAGFLLLFFPPITDAKVFGICYTLASAYFSRKMVRLVLLLSPSVCVTTGIVSGLFFDWAVMQLPYIRDFLTAASSSSSSTDSASTKNKKNKKSGSKSKSATASFLTTIKAQLERVKCVYPLVAVAILVGLVFLGFSFYQHSAMLAEHLSEPQIILRGTHEGKEVIIDDFREAYWWLRDNTPEDARVMAWWDYGYQINGIANRTSIADGNTWNHEHIALLGRTLVSNETESHKLARHLADYVLVWTTRLVGMQSDDIAKMPHMVRIAGSVYPDIKPNDYWLDQNSGGSPAMTESILYRMTFYRILPHVQPFKLFEEVYMTRNRMVRIYKVLKVAKRSPPRTYAKQLPVRKTFKHMRDPL